MTTYEQISLIIGSLNLVASYGGLALIYYGIREMARGAERRSADSERKHAVAMAESRRREEDGIRRHEEAMASLRVLIDGQAESRMALRELIDEQAESRMALRALIERTG